MKKNKTLNTKTRQKIYDFILEHPGLHMRELSRKMNIPISTLTYHLRHLEKNSFIVIDSQKRYERVYAKNNIGQMEKKLLYALRQKTSRDILLYIGLSYAASQSELSRELELSPTTIGKHLRRLVEWDLIEPTQVSNGMFTTSHKKKVLVEHSSYGREVIYKLTRSENPDVHLGALLEGMLNRYKKGLSDDFVKLAFEYINLVNPERKIPKKVKNRKYFFNRIEDRFYDIFPHPYHV